MKKMIRVVCKKEKIVFVYLAFTLLLLFGFSVCSIYNGDLKETTVAEDGLKDNSLEDTSKNSECEELVFSVACSGNFPSEQFERIGDFSNQKIKINYYPNGILGDDRTIIKGVQNGSISIMAGAPAGQIEVVPELALLDIPGVFKDIESCNEALMGELFHKFQTYYNKAGLELLSYRTNGFRELTSNRAIYSVEDFKDLKIRTMENPYHEAYWKALGADVISMPFGSIYFSLQQGKIHAQENLLASAFRGNIPEVQKYLIYTHHIPFINTYVMNKKLYDSLSKEEQRILKDFFTYQNDKAVENSESDNKNYKDACIEEYGMQVIYPEETLLQQMEKANEEVIHMLKKDLGAEVVEEYLQIIQKWRKQ
ncbi:MAG: TRAP transporter substrate-binding protein [Bacillota bacterium]